MKKTFIQLLMLLFCFTVSQYTYGQKKKKSFEVDTFYFETPKVKKIPYAILNSSTDSIQANKFVIRNSTFLPLFNSEETDFSLTREIKLTDNSGSKTIPIEVNKGSLELLLSVNCNLKSGTLNVEIYDPKGAKRGNFSVKGSNDKSGWAETVGGVINKRYGSPINGEWSLKFIAENVSADIMISTTIK